MNLETVKILRDLEYGNPRNNILVEKREIKKGQRLCLLISMKNYP